MRDVQAYLYKSIFTFEVGDELEEIISNGVCVGLEALLLLRLLLHVADETCYLLHDVGVRRVFVSQFDAKIEENELKDVLLVFKGKRVGQTQRLAFSMFAFLSKCINFL